MINCTVDRRFRMINPLDYTKWETHRKLSILSLLRIFDFFDKQAHMSIVGPIIRYGTLSRTGTLCHTVSTEVQML